ncbi:MAG: hypothetical protein QOE47_2364 [Pyrinomonadaceae bacterium]|nr:hypothetical protein [Pyrinomonadaceae bacterium]
MSDKQRHELEETHSPSAAGDIDVRAAAQVLVRYVGMETPDGGSRWRS